MTNAALLAPDSEVPDQSGYQPISLVDLLDRLLGTGVVLHGDLVISIAGIDLVEVRLRALITSVGRELSQDEQP